MLGLVTFQSKKSIQDVSVGAELNGEQRNEIMEVLRRYEEIFTEIPRRASLIERTIDLTDDRPIRCKPYPLPHAKRSEIREKIKNMMDTGIVRESSSPCASPLVVVKKKDGSKKMCVDYRKFNLVTVADPAPMTTAEDFWNEELWSNVGSWHAKATSRHGQCRALYRRFDCLLKGLGCSSAGA